MEKLSISGNVLRSSDTETGTQKNILTMDIQDHYDEGHLPTRISLDADETVTVAMDHWTTSTFVAIKVNTPDTSLAYPWSYQVEVDFNSAGRYITCRQLVLSGGNITSIQLHNQNAAAIVVEVVAGGPVD